MIPVGSNYPTSIDTDDNLFLVHDALRLKLSEDYNPGDTSITTIGTPVVMSRMPPTGIITLTEQCSDLALRAISLYYSSFDSTTGIFSGLELLPEFIDVIKPKTITDVTINVLDLHHNNTKDALIAMQTFFGVKGTVDSQPFGETLEGRINFLRKIVLKPLAWFTSDVRTGNVPLAVEFENMSFRLGTDGNTGTIKATWDFGDHTSSTISITSVITADSVVPASPIDVLVLDSDNTIKKTYYQPGTYDVKLTVENDFGSDTVIFEDFINARTKAPNEAIMRFVSNSATQIIVNGVPPNGPFDVFPTIRSPINTLIQIEVPTGENISTPGYSFNGELLNDSNNPIDPVISWTWELGDDLNHPNGNQTTAAYSVGGFYDVKLRVDTEFGAYRITTYTNSIDIVENTNLWLFIFQDNTTTLAYEYGLISESFKLVNMPSLTVNQNDSFLTGAPNETQQKNEFNRNVGFNPRSTSPSGQGAASLLYWASGRNSYDPVTSESINVVEFDAFAGTFITKPSITRQWNWANLNSPQKSYFVFGAVPSYLPNVSNTNTTLQTLDVNTLGVTSTSLNSGNYLNGAQELTSNVSIFDTEGNSLYGNFSVYRTAWKDSTGYIARNDGVGPFFRIKSFYRTEGTISSPVININKLQDIQGPTKLEGDLATLGDGVYFLNNSGSVSKFSPTSTTWTTGGPGVNSLLYTSLQDTSVIGYNSQENTLLVASDGDMRAYLSFDYSPNTFIKFNETDLTFSTLGSRPEGKQFIMAVY